LLTSEERVRIPHRFTAFPVAPGECRLHSWASSRILKGRAAELLERLLPLLDGTRCVGEIVAELNSFEAESVQITLQSLFDAGILESADETGAGVLSLDEVRRLRPQIAFFSHFVVPTGIEAVRSPTGTLPRSGIEYQERLKQSNIAVFGMGRLGSQLVRSLASAGVGTITAIDQQPPAANEFIADGWLDENEPGTDRVGVAGKLCTAVNPRLKFRTKKPPSDQQALIRLLDECDTRTRRNTPPSTPPPWHRRRCGRVLGSPVSSSTLAPR
jgi:ThiF family